MDYLEFFGLKEDPFKITPDITYFYPSKEHNEILTALNYAVTQKEGFFLLLYLSYGWIRNLFSLV